MSADPLAELLALSKDPVLAERGGSHNQKGVEFQKNWSLLRMFALEEGGAGDFLFLFEVVQDVAVVDSPSAPTKIALYQVKKKDRGEWTWTALTKLKKPKEPKAPSQKKTTAQANAKSVADVKDSPLGKLYAALNAFQILESSGCFVSNQGCDVPLENGGNAATSLPVPLDSLPQPYKDLLGPALSSICPGSGTSPDLHKLMLEKVDMSTDDAVTHAVGKAHAFLLRRSPTHAGQAQALVEALLVKIGPLGAKTSTCNSFAEMVSQHGFSRTQFIEAIATLQHVPDPLQHLERWLIQLQNEGAGWLELTGLKDAASGIYRRKLVSSLAPSEAEIADACDAWLSIQQDPILLRPFLAAGTEHLVALFPYAKQRELQAHLVLKAIIRCVDQNLDAS